MKHSHILFASLIGTTIEFFDFYIYGTAAAVVFPSLFFPSGNPATATLQSLATFALAFLARPVGSAIFGHFGDRIGRKATLVAALMTMGLSTVCIGFLPTYASIGIAAPALLGLCRFGQGIGLGGEWGGAVLLATENAPPGKKAWYGMFPQLGAPIGFIAANGLFVLLGILMSEEQFFSWGWRIPFIASLLLVWVGLYVRLQLTETPAFTATLERNERVEVPIITVLRDHAGILVLTTLAAVTTFVIFYLMTVFTLSWGTAHLGFKRQDFLLLQILGVVFFGIGIPLSAKLAERMGSLKMLIIATLIIIAFSFVFGPLFTADKTEVLLMLCLGLAGMGLTYGPLGTALSSAFPTAVRYTGASLAFNFAGILGASFTPLIATDLANDYGLNAVGYYLCSAGVVTLLALLLIKARSSAEQS